MPESDRRRLYREQAPRAPEGLFSLESVLEGTGPIELDIGFGRGLSLFERAALAPESRILGIEVKTKLAYQVDQRLRKRQVANVSVFCGDAREILKRAEPDRSVRRVSLHFPDPWWKKRHDKRRVIGETLLGELERLMDSLKPKLSSLKMPGPAIALPLIHLQLREGASTYPYQK